MTDTMLSRLADALRECSDDIECYVEANYPNRSAYPSEMNKYNRDIRIVERARALLAEWEEKKQRWRQAP